MPTEDDRAAPGSPGVNPEEADVVHEVDVVDVESVEALPSGTPPQEAALHPRDDRPMTVGDVFDGVGGLVSSVGTGARRLFDRGRYRKVRVSRKGKKVLPDIPVAAVAAAEVASLYGAGWARVLAVNVGARFLFDIEIVNEADRYYRRGVEHYLDGDLERAEETLLKAVRIDDTHAKAYLQLGVLYRMQKLTDQAEAVLERARRLDDAGDVGKKAGDLLKALREH